MFAPPPRPRPPQRSPLAPPRAAREHPSERPGARRRAALGGLGTAAQEGGGKGRQGARSGEGRGTGGWGKRGETWCCSCHNADYLGFVCDPPLLA
jgi:hypothetical protein